MDENKNSKPNTLEDRTFEFARRVRAFVRMIQKDGPNTEDAIQVVRSSGAVGESYIEANEALSQKVFQMRIKVCWKEAKKSRFWLGLISTNEDALCEKERLDLVQEAKELTTLFRAIVTKSP